MESLSKILDSVSSVVWGWPLIILLFGTHIYLTFRTGFIQKYLIYAIKLSFGKESTEKGDISHFGALATALAATIGTGNIVGVSTAVAMGGPGAVLWMWFTGIFGIATKYSEALLSVKYRITAEDGSYAGGPMYVLERGLNMKWLGVLFAIFTAIAAFGIGNMVQANSIAEMTASNFGVSKIITGIILAVLTFVVIIGGVKSIAKICEGLIPFMAIFYVIGCLIILLINYDKLADALMIIVRGAFSPLAATGGFAGSVLKETIRYGIARGLFSNESGLGSAPIVAAAARTEEPVRQALVSSTGTFWDTVVICLITGFTVVSSGDWLLGKSGAELTTSAFSHIRIIGPLVLNVGLLTFVFSTIIGWSYYGEKAAEYLFGSRIKIFYRILWVAAVFIGAILSLPVVWTFADIANGLMAVPNLIALLLLSKVVTDETKYYFDRIEKS
ncbi:MAG: sodium:alanine symporter family protein [Deltaproteobacteria bacterium]|nr:sodium:alanine symporter family protein [Deltaproteobacteria bacterium]